MSTRPYLTAEQRARIIAEYPTRGARALAKEMGIAKYHVKNLVHRLRLKRDAQEHERRPLTDVERATLEQLYPTTKTEVIAAQLGRSTASVYRAAYKMGLKKSPAFLQSEASGRMKAGSQIGIATRFQKGVPSKTKGVRLTPERYAKLQPTMFKKGSLPHNTKYDGHLSVRRDSDGRQYIWIRVRLGKYEMLHRHLWMQAHGPVPAGHVVTFKDGNQANCVLENLECITEAERLRRTSIHNYPPEIRSAMRTLAKLERTIREHGKEQDGGPAGTPVHGDRNGEERRVEA